MTTRALHISRGPWIAAAPLQTSMTRNLFLNLRRCNNRSTISSCRIETTPRSFCTVKLEETETSKENEAVISEAQRKGTLRLVESSMLAATAGLAYFLSNLLRLESYFGCFFPLPIVISSLRWGAAAGRKTMVTTTLLVFVIAGPVKATSYLLMHGLLGLAMGSFWRWKFSWGLSILLSSLVRACGALGFVLLSSWLFKENILNLITINTHASLSYIAASLGINMVFTMRMIYLVFTFLLMVNCASFVFILHVLYVVFLHRLGITSTLTMPLWLKKAV